MNLLAAKIVEINTNKTLCTKAQLALILNFCSENRLHHNLGSVLWDVAKDQLSKSDLLVKIPNFDGCSNAIDVLSMMVDVMGWSEQSQLLMMIESVQCMGQSNEAADYIDNIIQMDSEINGLVA